MNFFQLVKTILDVCKSHDLVQEVHYGDIYEFENSGSRKYMNVVLTITQAAQGDNITTYSFSLFATDRLTDDRGNKLAVQSVCKTTLTQIMEILIIKGITLADVPKFTFWTEKFNDLCAGCYASFSVSVPNEAICAETEDYNPQQIKSVTYTENGDYFVIPDSGFEGLSRVNIEVDVHTPQQTKSVTLSKNGDYTVTPDSGFEGLSKVDVEVALPLQEKTITFTENGVTTILPAEEFEGLSKVDVTVNVPSQASTAPQFVTFWDFKGNVLASYKEDEVATIEYPIPPDYSDLGLVFYGWSETLEEIRSTTQALDVICRYESDTIKIFLEIPEDNTEFELRWYKDYGDYLVDWGDGSPKEAYATSRTHTYAAGEYVIEVVPPAAAEGQNQHAMVNKNVVVGFIADKTMAYSSGAPLWSSIQNGSITYAWFFNMQFLVHSYRHISSDIDNVYYTTFYPNIPVNDFKGRFVNSDNPYYGQVLKDPIITSSIYPSATNIRFVHFLVDEGTGRIGGAATCYNAENVYFHDVDKITAGSAFTFSNYRKIREIRDYPLKDIALRTTLAQMFYNCYSLQTVDVSEWDVSKVTNMSSMFNACYSLQTLDVSGWDVSKVTNMNMMFYNCYSLQTVDVSEWDVSKVTNMSRMFNYCSSLQTVDVSGWDVSKVTDMQRMFYNCSSLQTIIGSHTLEEVEAGTVVALKNAGTGTYIDLRNAPALHYSSFLATIKGAYDRKAAGLSNQTFYLSRTAYNACYNDDGTTPDTTVITERQAEFTALLTAKGYNLAFA